MKKEYLCEECAKPRFGGSAMTGWECTECGETFIYGSTDTPMLCHRCSEALNQCEHCGKLLK